MLQPLNKQELLCQLTSELLALKTEISGLLDTTCLAIQNCDSTVGSIEADLSAFSDIATRVLGKLATMREILTYWPDGDEKFALRFQVFRKLVHDLTHVHRILREVMEHEAGYARRLAGLEEA